ncbi:hypothetical protein PCE1_003309 [Barthelona sp. PCE]
MDSNLLNRAMLRLDPRGTGNVSVNSILTQFRRLKFKISRTAVEDGVWSIDSDGNGYLSHADIENTIEQAKTDRTAPTKIINLVEFLGYEEDGYITLDQCILLLASRFGKLLTQADIHNLWFDTSSGLSDMNELVSYAEFLRQLELTSLIIS